MDLTEITAVFDAVGLTRFNAVIGKLAEPSLRLTATPADDAFLPVGASKIGGLPDLAPGAQWPAMNGAPMSFVAQMRLQDAHRLDEAGLLPSAGLLSFFYDASQQTYGSDPNDRAGFAILYTSEDVHSSLIREMNWPDKLLDSSRFQSCSLAFTPELTLPQDLRAEFPDMGVTLQEQQAFELALDKLRQRSVAAPPRHRLLGWPDTIQDDMRLQCQLAANGIVDPASEPQRVAELASGANDWRLLLQVDSDDRIGMRWASAGTLYYWIRRQGLADARFDRCWVVLQSD